MWDLSSSGQPVEPSNDDAQMRIPSSKIPNSRTTPGAPAAAKSVDISPADRDHIGAECIGGTLPDTSVVRSSVSRKIKRAPASRPERIKASAARPLETLIVFLVLIDPGKNITRLYMVAVTPTLFGECSL